MSTQARIKQLEKIRGADKKSGRYAIHCTTSNTVLVDGVTMTLAEWDKIKTDKDLVVRVCIASDRL
jgi:hypothetical protein